MTAYLFDNKNLGPKRSPGIREPPQAHQSAAGPVQANSGRVDEDLIDQFYSEHDRLISDVRADTYLLQQGGVRSKRPLNRLENQLRLLSTESREAITPMLTRPVRFMVRTVDFVMMPTPPPNAERAAFEVDDRAGPIASRPESEKGRPPHSHEAVRRRDRRHLPHHRR